MFYNDFRRNGEEKAANRKVSTGGKPIDTPLVVGKYRAHRSCLLSVFSAFSTNQTCFFSRWIHLTWFFRYLTKTRSDQSGCSFSMVRPSVSLDEKHHRDPTNYALFPFLGFPHRRGIWFLIILPSIHCTADRTKSIHLI